MDSITELLRNLFNSDGFMPRWVCGKWSEFHGWIYILSNLAVWAAYFTIPLLLLKFIKNKKGFVFKSVVICFILFIFFCGATHFIDALIFWVPVYRLNALILFLTALISWITVFILYKLLPIALEFKSPDELQHIIDEQTKELEIANFKLAESEKQFKTLVNSNPDVITRINKELKYEFVNDSILKVRKIKINEIIGQSLYERAGANDPKVMEAFIERVKNTFETGNVNKLEFATYTNTSQNSYFSLSIIPLENPFGDKPEHVLTITKDITAQKLIEIAAAENIANLEMLAKKLENKRRILEDFTYIVSHNLRSPVSNLSSLIRLIQEENDPEFRNVLFQKIIVAFDHLSGTVNDLTEVVQIRQNTEIRRELLSFKEIFDKHLVNLETQIVETNAEIISDFSECEYVEYPKIYLESILLNLLTNALKYRKPQVRPKIIFTTKVDKDGIISLVCEDNGLGIDLKRHGHKLFGLRKTFHEHPDSKGIGLFITKNQIETMGGSISAQSEVGVGTKFTILFNNYNNLWSEK